MTDHNDALKEFEMRAQVSFTDPELLRRAFTHRSYINESPRGRLPNGREEHNERLEFLGDAVLEIVVTDHLYRVYPRATEGDLTAYRAALVNATTLAGVAEDLNMNACLLLSKGEAKDTGRGRSTILANALGERYILWNCLTSPGHIRPKLGWRRN